MVAIQSLWPIIETAVINIFNACLKMGTFPALWKIGKVVIIPKGGDKDPSDPKNNRPILLLSVLGKTLEKLINGRILRCINKSGGLSSKQYGFRKGKSTEDAVCQLVDTVQNCESKYAIGLFLDISGAFDNLWWPSIMAALKKRGCPPNICNLVSNYLSERVARIKDEYNSL